MTPKHRAYLADALLLIACVIWGSTYIITKGAIEHLTPFAFLTLRFAVASVILWGICIPRYKSLNPKLLKDGLFLGTALFLTFAFQTLGLQYTQASAAAFITGLYVVIVPILSALMLKNIPHPASLTGVVLAVAGLGLITLKGEIGPSKGEFFVLLCSVACSVHILMTDTYSRKHDIYLLTAVQMTVILILSTIFSIGFEPSILPARFTPRLVFAILLTGLFATVLAFLVMMAVQKYTTPTKASILYMMEPVASIFFGWLLAGELLSARQYMGATLIILAMLTAELGSTLRFRILPRVRGTGN